MKPTLYALIAAITLGLNIPTAQAQPCIDNFSGVFPCQFVDQLSQIPLEVFQANNGNDSWGWTSPTTGREYVLFGLRNKTAFIDITSPQFPIYLGYIPTATVGSLWRDVKVIDNYVFIVAEAENHGLQIFDLTRLENLASIDIPVIFDVDAFYGGFGNSHNVVADTANHYIYAVGSNTVGGGLHIVDVSNPLSPVFAGSSDQAGYSHDAQVVNYIGPDADYQGKQIALGFNEDVVVVYDVTDKTDVEVVSATGYDFVGYTHQGWFTDDQRYGLSNDEIDELNFDIDTRTIIWDMADLDNPQVLGYVDLGTNSIDHNLYIHGDMVYESNYTSGLRILDLMDVLNDGTPHLEPFGYFDVYPDGDIDQFEGTWSNYPYFKSGVVAISTFFTGLHIVKPNFFQLESQVLRVCDQDNAEMPFAVNRRFNSVVNYSVSMDDWPGTAPVLSATSTAFAPADNAVIFTNLGVVPSGYYSGKVTIDHANGQTVLPFVVATEDIGDLEGSVLVSPIDQTFNTQLISFTIEDDNPAYYVLEVALDPNFGEIVYQETFFNAGTTVQAYMPFQTTVYYWRVRKPTACGNDLISPVASFTIDVVSGLFAAQPKPLWSVFPNPAADQFRISGLSGKPSVLSVFDLSGRLVRQWNTSSVTFEGDVSDLAPGVYMIRSSVELGTQKIVVN